MNIATMMNNMTTGGILSIVIIILSLIEITPIKISPLKWIGKRVNAEAMERLTKVEAKLDEHIAQSYRNKILSAQNSLLNGQRLTQEEFNEIIEACQNYEQYCEENKLRNEKCKLAISYIYHSYKKCQDERTFAHLPIIGG